MKHFTVLYAMAAFAVLTVPAHAAVKPPVVISVQESGGDATVCIVVRQWDRDGVDVQKTAQHGQLDDLQVQVSRGSGVRIDARYDVHKAGLFVWLWHDRYTLNVRVPAGTAVTVDNSIGGVDVSGSLPSVEARVGNGGVRIEAGSNVIARTGNGGIHVTIPSGAAPHVDLRTGNGGIALTLPHGTTTRIDARTGNGGVQNPLSDGNGPGSIVLRTGNGGIHVTVAQ